MLKGIPSILSPDLLKVLAEMGHGDEITIADAHYPLSGAGGQIIRADGHRICDLLEAVMRYFPLDRYNEWQYALMEPVAGDTAPDIWQSYGEIVGRHEHAETTLFERFEFYRRASHSHATIMTSETAQYANIILKKGVIVNSSEVGRN